MATEDAEITERKRPVPFRQRFDLLEAIYPVAHNASLQHGDTLGVDISHETTEK